MRGLRLFVRPIEHSDQGDIEAFLIRQNDSLFAQERPPGPRQTPNASHQLPTAAPACGLLGKLLGDIVAVVWLEITSDALRVEAILVASELRRKWIGRMMMGEGGPGTIQKRVRIIRGPQGEDVDIDVREE